MILFLLFPLPTLSVWFTWLSRQRPAWLCQVFFPSSAGQMADAAKLGCRQRASCPSCVSAPGQHLWGRVLPEGTAAHVPYPGAGPTWQGLPAQGLLACRGVPAHPGQVWGAKIPSHPKSRDASAVRSGPALPWLATVSLCRPARWHTLPPRSPSLRPDSPPRPLIRTGPSPEHAGYPFPAPPARSGPAAETPTQLPVPGAGPFAGWTRAGSPRRDLAAWRAVSAERALGSAPPPARRAWALARHRCALIRAAGVWGPSLGEV